jgi:hypothetical protein
VAAFCRATGRFAAGEVHGIGRTIGGRYVGEPSSAARRAIDARDVRIRNSNSRPRSTASCAAVVFTTSACGIRINPNGKTTRLFSGRRKVMNVIFLAGHEIAD